MYHYCKTLSFNINSWTFYCSNISHHYQCFFFQLCFAYTGGLKDEVGIKFTYEKSNGQTITQLAKINTFFNKEPKWVKSKKWPLWATRAVVRISAGFLGNFLFFSFYRWSYKCLDLLSSLQTEYIGSKYTLLELYLYKDNSGADFYVDAVYIGKWLTTNEENGTIQ